MLLIWTGVPVGAAEPTLVVRDAWARPTPPGVEVGAAYLTLENRGGEPDRLIGAASPAAARVMLHETVVEGGAMKMRHVEALDVPPGGVLTLAPGGRHLMLTGLRAPLRPGDRFRLVLRLEHAGEVETEVTVRPMDPTGASGSGHGGHSAH